MALKAIKLGQWQQVSPPGGTHIIERVCKTPEKEEEEENTITFHLKCIVIA